MDSINIGPCILLFVLVAFGVLPSFVIGRSKRRKLHATVEADVTDLDHNGQGEADDPGGPADVSMHFPADVPVLVPKRPAPRVGVTVREQQLEDALWDMWQSFERAAPYTGQHDLLVACIQRHPIVMQVKMIKLLDKCFPSKEVVR